MKVQNHENTKDTNMNVSLRYFRDFRGDFVLSCSGDSLTAEKYVEVFRLARKE